MEHGPLESQMASEPQPRVPQETSQATNGMPETSKDYQHMKMFTRMAPAILEPLLSRERRSNIHSISRRPGEPSDACSLPPIISW